MHKKVIWLIALSMSARLVWANSGPIAWESKCLLLMEKGTGNPGTYRIEIGDEENLVYRLTYFKTTSKLTCTTKRFTFQIQGSGKGIPLSVHPTIFPRKVDITYHTILAAVHDAANIPYLNSIKWCGYTDWKVDTFKPVSDAQCGAGGGWGMPGQKLYSIFKIQNDGTFHWGKGKGSQNGSTPNLRHNLLDWDVPLYPVSQKSQSDE